MPVRHLHLRVRTALLACSLIATWSPPLCCAEDRSPAVDLSNITVPLEHGYLLSISPASNADAPVIIHIQEAHADPNTQAHLVAILEHVIQRYGLRLILVEGGAGDVSLSYFRDYGSLKQRKQAA